MTRSLKFLTTSAMVLCLGTSAVNASNTSDFLDNEKTKSYRTVNPLSLTNLGRTLVIAAAYFSGVDGFKTPGRFTANPLQKNTKINGFKEDAEHLIATKFLGKPADVQLEFNPGLGFWGKRAFYVQLYKNIFLSGKGSGPVFSKLQDDAEDIVPWTNLGIPAEGVYTSAKAPKSETSVAKNIVTTLISYLNRIIPLASGNLPQIPNDPSQLMKLIYPSEYSDLFPAPVYPLVLTNYQDNLVGALSLEGPFAAYIQRDPATGNFFIDMSAYEQYEAKDGLYRLGGKAFLEYDGQKMNTKLIRYKGVDYFPPQVNPEGADEWKRVQKIVLATLSTDCTFFRHLLHTHMITAGTFCAVNNKFLKANHPLRPIMHPFQYQTLSVNNYTIKILIGNEYQFVPTSFSYNFDITAKVFSDRIKSFDISLIVVVPFCKTVFTCF